jgi:hypothetical protein
MEYTESDLQYLNPIDNKKEILKFVNNYLLEFPNENCHKYDLILFLDLTLFSTIPNFADLRFEMFECLNYINSILYYDLIDILSDDVESWDTDKSKSRKTIYGFLLDSFIPSVSSS